VWFLMIDLIRRRWVLLVTTASAALIAIAGVTAVVGYFSGRPSQTIVARFAETPGLYVNNAVNILGVKTGTVTSVKASGSYVEVRMTLPADVKVPASARAIVMAPNPVSDRTIELYPPYTGGPALKSGDVIPLERTVAPLGVDQVFSEVDTLAKALGPLGANRNGSLSDAVHALARLTAGNGQLLQNTLAALAGALPAFTSNPTQLTELITSLDQLGGLLARHNSTIDLLLGDLTTATSQIASERDILAAAIANLQSGLSQIASFLQTNKSALTTTTRQLASTSQALISDQKALMTTFSTAALGFQNFNNAIDANAPCVAGEKARTCPIVFGRLDLPQDVAAVLATYCPPALSAGVPIVVHSLPAITQIPALKNVDTANNIDSLCVSSASVTQGHSGSPGAPQTPNLDLARFLK
jgi:virulence factor Mce-like protein